MRCALGRTRRCRRREAPHGAPSGQTRHCGSVKQEHGRLRVIGGAGGVGAPLPMRRKWRAHLTTAAPRRPRPFTMPNPLGGAWPAPFPSLLTVSSLFFSPRLASPRLVLTTPPSVSTLSTSCASRSLRASALYRELLCLSLLTHTRLFLWRPRISTQRVVFGQPLLQLALVHLVLRVHFPLR